MREFSRRSFLTSLVLSGTVPSKVSGRSFLASSQFTTKPILGSWFEFKHPNPPEGHYWNQTCAGFSCRDWELKVKEIAGVGMKYLVLLCTALDYRSFYPTKIFPRHDLTCLDPVECVLSAADKTGIRFFIGAGFYGDWASPAIISDPSASRRRLQAMEELTGLYGHHSSFYGWYWPNEASINPYYSKEFTEYVNTCSRQARKLTPRAPILIAPYGTRLAKPDENYIRQLEAMDVDIIAYQDEVGVEKSKVEEVPAFFEKLKKAHLRVPRIAIWADVEVFRFEGKVYQSALLPAPFERIKRQLDAVSPFVDTILIYQYQGMMNHPKSTVFAGHPDSRNLYSDYVAWLQQHHPSMVRR